MDGLDEVDGGLTGVERARPSLKNIRTKSSDNLISSSVSTEKFKSRLELTWMS